MYRLWCEYDYYQNDLVFTSQKAAIDWFNKTVMEVQGDSWAFYLFHRKQNEMLPYDLFNEQGLVGITKLEVI